MKVLVIKTSSLGDIIHTLPAITDATNALPNLTIDWVIEEDYAAIPKWHPNINTVIPVALRRWRKQLIRTWRSKEWQQFKSRLQKNQYDIVIDAQGLLKSALITRKARGKKIGLDKDSAREPIVSRFYDKKIHVPRQQHAVERIRQLFSQGLNYPLPENTGIYGLDLQQLTSAHNQNTKPYIVFLHGTTWNNKQWPLAFWQTLASMATHAGFMIRIPWGSETELNRANAIASNIESIQVLPKLNLTKIAEVLASAHAVISVDTGLSHLATALDIPTVTLFGPTSATLTGNYGKHQISLASQLPCSPCLKRHCIYKGNPLQAIDQYKQPFVIQPPCFHELNPELVWLTTSNLINNEKN